MPSLPAGYRLDSGFAAEVGGSSARFHHILQDEDVPEAYSQDFRKIWQTFEIMMETTSIEMRTPNLGEIAPESLTNEQLVNVEVAANEAMAYLNTVRRQIRSRLTKVKGVHDQALPNMQRQCSMRDLSTACHLWKVKISFFRSYPTLVTELFLLLPVLFDEYVYHPFLTTHRRYPTFNAWKLSAHFNTLFAIIEDLGHVILEAEGVAGALRENILNVERTVLASVSKLDKRTGRDGGAAEPGGLDTYIFPVKERRGFVVMKSRVTNKGNQRIWGSC